MNSFDDLAIVIENPRGTSKAFRRKSSGDPAWKDYPLAGVKYPVDYGYIGGFIGEDRMGLDIFVGSGDMFGYFKMWRVDVAEETKFFARVTSTELAQILEIFGPVLRCSKAMTEEEFMAEVERFRI